MRNVSDRGYPLKKVRNEIFSRNFCTEVLCGFLLYQQKIDAFVLIKGEVLTCDKHIILSIDVYCLLTCAK